jgi:hypothetical protein
MRRSTDEELAIDLPIAVFSTAVEETGDAQSLEAGGCCGHRRDSDVEPLSNLGDRMALGELGNHLESESGGRVLGLPTHSDQPATACPRESWYFPRQRRASSELVDVSATQPNRGRPFVFNNSFELAICDRESRSVI